MPDNLCTEVPRYLSYGWNWPLIAKLVKLRHTASYTAAELQDLFPMSRSQKDTLMLIEGALRAAAESR